MVILKEIIVFFIGILSSPLPYLLVAFTYMLAFSYGFFSKADKGISEDELKSNIVNFEQLTPEEAAESHLNCSYNDFLKEKETNNKVFDTPLCFSFSFNSNKVSIPIEYRHVFYSINYNSSLSNRPPPAIA